MHDQTTQAVNQHLGTVIQSRLQQAADMSPSYHFFWDSIATLVTSGKRVRPYLTMVGYGRYNPAIVPIAAAWELLHIAMLIHDDVIDQDTIRHGQDNLNGLYIKRYQGHVTGQPQIHYAHSASVLGGDALLSEAYHQVYSSPLPDQVKTAVAAQLHTAVYEVIAGELMDVEAPLLPDQPLDPLLIYQYKTASYSFVGPLVSGALCAALPATDLAALKKGGLNLGIGFQLQDDLLGIFGDEQATGKSSYTDLREAKRTQLIAVHTQRMNPQQRQRFDNSFGSTLATQNDLDQLKQDLIDSGAKHATEELVTTYFDTARQTLNQLTDSAQKQELFDFMYKLQQRNY